MADISGTTVVGMQGNSISTSSPSDGHALIWDASSNSWKPSSKLNSATFTSSGTWTCPNGVTTVWLTGWGGGGGGANGGTTTSLGSGGGGGASVSVVIVPVTPGNNYTVTIGTGGAAGADGSNTTFGSLATFVGGGKGGFQGQAFAGGNAPGITSNNFLFTTGFGGNPNYAATQSSTGYAGGTGASDSGSYLGGSGGGGGPGGTGGNGGNANNSGTGVNGSNGAANSGAGGGAGGSGSSGGGTGGSGGSGYLRITY